MGAALPLGLPLNLVSRWRAGRAERRELFVLPVMRNEAKQLRFPVGHPLPDVVYVGNPAVPAVYLREFTLHVRYEEDFSVDADLAAKVTKVGLKTGGSFQRHESTVWAISATFPPSQYRALRAIKHPFE